MEARRLMPSLRGLAALYISSSFSTQAPASSTRMSVAATGCEGVNERFTSTMLAWVV